MTKSMHHIVKKDNIMQDILLKSQTLKIIVKKGVQTKNCGLKLGPINEHYCI